MIGQRLGGDEADARQPSAKRTRLKGRRRATSIAATRLRAETSPKPSTSASRSGRRCRRRRGSGPPPGSAAPALAEPVDLHRPLADEVLDVLEGLPGTAGAVRADRENRVARLHRRRPAGRARFGGFGRRALRPARCSIGETTGGSCPGPHHHHLVALTDVLARQVLLVVEGRGADGDAADVNRLEHRERQQGAGPADVPDDLASRRAVVGGNFQAIARAARADDAELAPERPLVDLTTTPSISKSSSRGAPATRGSARPPRRRRRGGRCRDDLEAALAQPAELLAWVARSSPSVAPMPVAPDR